MLTIKVIEIQHLQPSPPPPTSAYQADDCLPLSVCVCVCRHCFIGNCKFARYELMTQAESRMENVT